MNDETYSTDRWFFVQRNSPEASGGMFRQAGFIIVTNALNARCMSPNLSEMQIQLQIAYSNKTCYIFHENILHEEKNAAREILTALR